MDASDIQLAKKVDMGEITPTDLVKTLLEDELPEDCGVDTLMLARRIVNALQY